MQNAKIICVPCCADVAAIALVQDVRVVRKFQMGKLEGGGGRDFSQTKSNKAVIEYESQSIGLTKVSPGNVRSNISRPLFTWSLSVGKPFLDSRLWA